MSANISSVQLGSNGHSDESLLCLQILDALRFLYAER